MKILKYTYLIVLAVVTAVMAACSSDSDDVVGSNSGDSLQLRITTGMTTRTRTTNWEDTNAQDEEMMNLWVVVITNTTDGAVQKCYACRPTAGSEREIDDVARIARGAYTVYSFANISVTNVCTLLGITAPNPIPSIGSSPTEIEVTGTVNHSNALAATATVNGNGFDPTAANNGFGESGIPMSNMQTIAATESSKDLIVVRMMAKIEVQIKNETGANITAKNVKFSNITANSSETTYDNLLLLPNISTAGANTMNYVHKDIKPNLAEEAEQADYTQPINKTIANGETEEVVFYVNESATPSNSFGLFYLTLEVDKGGGSSEFRYALISQKGSTTDDDDAWNYIARNDYRVIPIVLDDYKMDIIPYDFPPIGVYPASVKEEDGLFTINFHDYGHFHLVPTVKKLSDNSIVPFTATTPDYSSTKWGLVNNDFSESWGSWTDATKTSAVTDDGSFYRNGTESYITTNTDDDDVGGFPKWYANTSSPQWDPAGGTNYNPFIFGYIADPGVALTDDRKVYHEFTFNLYKQGMSVPRQMTYHLMMILDTDQMTYSRQFGASPATPIPRKRH